MTHAKILNNNPVLNIIVTILVGFQLFYFKNLGRP